MEEKKKGTPKFIETSIPETITCIISQPCHLPLKITDQTGLMYVLLLQIYNRMILI